MLHGMSKFADQSPVARRFPCLENHGSRVNVGGWGLRSESEKSGGGVGVLLGNGREVKTSGVSTDIERRSLVTEVRF